MPPSYTYTVDQYLHDLRRIRATGSATDETSFYPPFTNLLNAAGDTLKPKVFFSTQLRDEGAGRPDGGLFPVLRGRAPAHTAPQLSPIPDRGVVELKGPAHSLDVLAHSEQTRRYLLRYGLVLISNYREFRLLRLEAGRAIAVESYTLAASEADLFQRPTDPKHQELLPEFLRRVMLFQVPLTDPKDVAWFLASYAREAHARAEDHDLPFFRNVKQALEESLGITFEGERGDHFFRSTLVQTLFYGIFSAWVLWRRANQAVPHSSTASSSMSGSSGPTQTDAFNWRLAEDFLHVPILRKLFREISDRRTLDSIQIAELLDLAGGVLNRVQPSLFDVFRVEEAVAYFYEPFLEAFDPALRKELGVWYTPREIVGYMVERVDTLLRTELAQPLGLASPHVRILDPCCGTGAYLTAVLGRIHRTLLEQAGDDPWQVPDKLRAAALTRVFGFEIMPAPFVIAHMEINRILEEAGAPLTGNERAGVFLTNALTGWEPVRHPQIIMYPEMEQEREAAEAIKQRDTILVILGNPPYNGYAGLALGEERDLSTCYRGKTPGLPNPEGKGLNDLYVRFFRVAERRITGSSLTTGNFPSRGIVCLISNSSWLDGFSHPTMRSHMMRSFSTIKIDNLNGDKYRTGKKTPNGESDPSIFSTETNKEGIQPGTAITTLIKSNDHAASFVFLRALWGVAKRAQLLRESNGQLETPYSEVIPEPLLGLPYASLTYTQEYLSWPLISELFRMNFNGVQTSRDSLLVDVDRESLEKRMNRFLSAPSQISTYAHWQIRRFLYRPFDLRYVYWEGNSDLLVRSREEYIGGYFGSPSIVLSKQDRISYAGPLVSSSVVDLNSVDAGANIFTEAFTTFDTLHGSALVDNWSLSARKWLGEVQGTASDLFSHVLAVTHCPRYTSENIGALQRDWPRIPLPATAELLAHSAALGRTLANLLDPESTAALSPAHSFLAALKLPARAGNPGLNPEDLRLTAGWGARGQGSTVMPGRGRTAERPWTAAERAKLQVLDPDAEALLGQTCVDVYLNHPSGDEGSVFWSAVPVNVWTYTLGGYQVLKKWLSYREFPLLGRPLKTEEAAWFSEVVRRIAAILLLGPALDRSYAAIVPTATGLPATRRT